MRLVYVSGATAHACPRGGSGVIFAPETTASSLGVLELLSGDRTVFLLLHSTQVANSVKILA